MSLITFPTLAEDWQPYLMSELNAPYFKQLQTFILAENQQATIYPPLEQCFRAFSTCHFADLKVVILGQDPYHDVGQANGLCFAVNRGIKLPPSLKNIFKELQADIGQFQGESHLEQWAQQGVLLLNSILTVRAHEAASHRGKGWEQFTDAVIQLINQQCNHIVFLLWGKYAQDKGKWIDKQRHCVLTAGHPSPLSVRHFSGCRHFSQANAYLNQAGKTPIIW